MTVEMFSAIELKEEELETLVKKYDGLKEQGLSEDHPRIQFVIDEFKRCLADYESACRDAA